MMAAVILTRPSTRRPPCTMNTSFPLPLNASRQSGFTTALRLLLATTADLWMGTAQPHGTTTLQQRAPTGTAARCTPSQPK